MKSNKSLIWIVFVFLVVFAVSPAFALSGNLQETTPPTVESIAGLADVLSWIVSAFVVFGAKFAFQTWGIDLSGKATQITAALTLAVMEFLNGSIAALPPEAYPFVSLILGFIVGLLALFGIGSVIKKAVPALNAPAKK